MLTSRDYSKVILQQKLSIRPHLFMNKRSAHVRRDRVESTGTNDVNPFGLGLLVVLQLNLLQELRLSRDVNVMSAPGKAGLNNLET